MGVKLSEIRELLHANVFVGNNRLDLDVDTACASDLMSDLLRGELEGSLLITGLNSIHIVKTAVISGIVGVVLVRGKEPSIEVIEEAKKYDLPLLATSFSMYTACGRLFKKGIRGPDGRTSSSSKKGI